MTTPEFHRSGRQAFTLIEMLVTIVIILLLTAILLRTAATFGEEGRRKKAVYELEQLQNALNEFFTEYGSYPPVDFVAYQYESTVSNHQSQHVQDWLAAPGRNDPEHPDFFPDMMRGPDDWPHSGTYGRGLGYSYGLVSYLWPRDRNSGQTHWYDRDTDRDRHAKSRWSPFLQDVGLSVGHVAHTSTPAMGSFAWTNLSATVRDPWGRSYRYESRPPFVRYRIWSTGPRGPGYPEDNISYESWSE